MKVLRPWFNRIFIFAGVLILLLLVMDLNSRMVHMIQLRGEMEAELSRVNDLKAIESELDKAIEYAESNEIVDKWARQENWMQKDGDYLIVLIPNGDPPPETVTEIAVPQQDLENWETWKRWLTFQE